MRIVFLGTPDFAVASLKALLAAQYQVVAVVTAPDKPAGRGQKLQESPVKQFAVQQSIPVLQPSNLKAPEFIENLKSYHADLQVVVAFRMLPEVVWMMPSLGTINVHGSLLPQFRGAAPINHAIIQGEKETGVSTFFLQHEIDTGNLILAAKTPILETDDAGSLHDKLMLLGAETLVKTLKQIQEGNYTEIPQPRNSALKHAPKISKSFCQINWHQNTETIYNHIRGLSPYPTAFSYLHQKVLKIFKTQKEIISHTASPGTFHSDGKTFLKIATNDGFLQLIELQIEGKKRMLIADFLRGNKIESIS